MTGVGDEADGIRIAAIVPVAAIETGKTRLGGSLDAEERHDLVERLLGRTLAVLLSVARLQDVVVVSPDRTVLDLAAETGARTLRQRTRGLNEGIREARDDALAGGAEAMIVVPIDLPFITGAAIDDVLGPLLDGASPIAVLVTDRHATGTNVLALRPPDAIDVAFGIDSRSAHRTAAQVADVRYVERDGPLSVDLDTPEDLVFIGTLDPDGLRAG